MTKKTMRARDWAFLLSDDDDGLSRNSVTIPAGTGEIEAGTVLGELTASAGHFVPSPDAETAGIEGAEVAKAVLGCAVDATTTAVEVAVIDAVAQVKIGQLVFDASVNDATKTAAKIAQLEAAGIRAR